MTLADTVPLNASSTEKGEEPVHVEVSAQEDKSDPGMMNDQGKNPPDTMKTGHKKMPARAGDGNQGHKDKKFYGNKMADGDKSDHRDKSGQDAISAHGSKPAQGEAPPDYDVPPPKVVQADGKTVEHGDAAEHGSAKTEMVGQETPKNKMHEKPMADGHGDAEAINHPNAASAEHKNSETMELNEAAATEHEEPKADVHVTSDEHEKPSAKGHDAADASGHGEANADEHGEPASTEHGEVAADGHGEDHAEEGEHGAHDEQFETSLDPLPEGQNQPWQLIRRIQLLQDKIARGGTDALKNYRTALVYASQKMLEDKSVATWSHERNVTAAATYLLIGGNPEVGKQAFILSPLSAIQKKPLGAALSYVGRRYVRANRLLLEVNIDRLPSSAKGQFALIKAMVTSSTETEKARLHLDQARRYAPGTLTEEAALRRLIRIAGGQIDTKEGAERLLRYASAYLRHFSNSIYVTDFLRNYGFGVVRALSEMSPKTLAHLKAFFPKLQKKHQVFLIAIVARNAVVLGKIELGRWASTWLLENVAIDDKLHARIELYELATSILDPESYADSAARLDKLPTEILGKQDKRLYLALRKMSDRIGSQPVNVERLKELSLIENQSFPGDEPELPFDVGEETKLAESNSLLVKTRNLFAQADKLLEE